MRLVAGGVFLRSWSGLRLSSPFLCSSWQQTQALVAETNHYRQLRVWTVDGGAHFLRDPWFRGDTLGEGSVAIPIDQIAKVEAWRFSGPKTALLVVGVGAVQYWSRARSISSL
jgi:hypothetical protein